MKLVNRNSYVTKIGSHFGQSEVNKQTITNDFRTSSASVSALKPLERMPAPDNKPQY